MSTQGLHARQFSIIAFMVEIMPNYNADYGNSGYFDPDKFQSGGEDNGGLVF